MQYIFFIILFWQSLAHTTTLHIGETLTIQTRKNLWVEKKGILSIQEQPGAYKIRALSPGKTSLSYGNEFKIIEVLTPKEMETVHNLKELIEKKTIGLKLSKENGKVYVRGTIYRFQDILKIRNFCYEVQCHFLLKPDRIINEPFIEKNLIEFLKQKGHKDFIINVPQMIIKTHKISEDLLKESQSWGFSAEEDRSGFSLKPSVRAQIHFIEIRKEALKNLGIQTPTAFEVDPTQNFKVLSNLLIQINALESSGKARVIASPNLLVRSGESSDFFAGGEVPIRNATRYKSEVIWKKYGLTLKLNPQVDSWDRIRMSIDIEVSSLDYSVAVDGVPGLRTNKVSSHFDLKESQSVILSGLIRKDEGGSKSGLQSLMNLPILGPLFRSESFRADETELLVIVSPNVE